MAASRVEWIQWRVPSGPRWRSVLVMARTGISGAPARCRSEAKPHRPLIPVLVMKSYTHPPPVGRGRSLLTVVQQLLRRRHQALSPPKHVGAAILAKRTNGPFGQCE